MTSAAMELVDDAGTSSVAVEAVAAAARRGDHAAWDWIFDRYYRTVLRYCAGRLGASQHAEDAAQEVFVAAVSSLGRLRDTSEVGIEGWLLGIARYKCIDQMRALRRRPVDDPVSVDVEDAADAAIGRLTAGEMRTALARLGELQREVVVRRFVMQESLEEVSRAMRRPIGAVKSLQHRALARLAKCCQELRP